MAKLADLKTLLAAAPKRRRPSVRSSATDSGRSVAPNPKDAAADMDLARAFADVAPLASGNRARLPKMPASTVPIKRLADEADALAASRHSVGSSPEAWDVGREMESEQTFHRPGLGIDVVSKLRRGHWVVQSELDLHGHTSEEARNALAVFLAEARSHGWRCVRIIHGKGLSSPNREPVLKAKVRRWLTRRDEVLAYSEAPPHGGGSGALLVLLVGASA